MTISIDKLVSHINNNFPTKPWNYEVNIFGPGIVPDSSPSLMLQCSGANVPGVNLGIAQERRHTIGHLKALPSSKSYTEITLTMYESEREPEREYFTNWINLIYNTENKRFSFYKDIVKTIQIIQYDKKRNKTYECLLIDAFPSNISPLDRSYAAGDSLAQFTVNIQFFEMKETFFDSPDGTRPVGLFQNIF